MWSEVIPYLPTISMGIILFIAGFYLKNYFPSYFNEKGKNLAQKEDIAEITKSIENVKSAFLQETEKLRSNLHRINSIEISHRNEERSAIIEFYDVYCKWLYSILEITLMDFGTDNFQDMKQYRVEQGKFYAMTGTAQSKIRLLVRSGEVIELSGRLWVALIDYFNWMEKKMEDLHRNLMIQKRVNESYMPFLGDNSKREFVVKKIKEERMLMESESKIKDDFMNEKTIKYKDLLANLDFHFTEAAKKYLLN